MEQNIVDTIYTYNHTMYNIIDYTWYLKNEFLRQPKFLLSNLFVLFIYHLKLNRISMFSLFWSIFWKT